MEDGVTVNKQSPSFLTKMIAGTILSIGVAIALLIAAVVIGFLAKGVIEIWSSI
jgi:hypothetical protein